jgi:type VI secretion system secreted protein Hcp
MAAVDYFLKVQGIDGESQDKTHKGDIQIDSFSWGATNAGTAAAGGGMGAGRVRMQDFHFVMKANKASPKLMLACANGEHIPKAVLVCRKAGKEQQEYLKYTFYDLLISSFRTGGGDPGLAATSTPEVPGGGKSPLWRNPGLAATSTPEVPGGGKSPLWRNPDDFSGAISPHLIKWDDYGGGIMPTEGISFNFSKLEMEYKEQKADGTLGGAIKVGYDIKTQVSS